MLDEINSKIYNNFIILNGTLGAKKIPIHTVQWQQHSALVLLFYSPNILFFSSCKVYGLMDSYQSNLVTFRSCWASKQKIKRNFTFQYDNNPKQTSKSPKKWLNQRFLNNPTSNKNLWVRILNPYNSINIKSRCATLIDSYPKRLSGVKKSKGASNIVFECVHTCVQPVYCQFFPPKMFLIVFHFIFIPFLEEWCKEL